MALSFSTIFPSIKGLSEVIHSVDASIVSDEGKTVMQDKKKMQKVKEAIEKRHESKESRSIMVKFD